MKAMIANLCCVGCLAASAIDVTFPASSNPGDLSSPGSWGLPALPDATNRVMFIKAGASLNQTVTASADLDVGGFGIGSETTHVTIDLRPETTGAADVRQVNLSGAVTMHPSFWYQTFHLRGGRWNFNGNNLGIFNGSYSGRPKYSKLYATDGFSAYDVAHIIGSWNDAGGQLYFSGEGTVVTAQTLRVVVHSAQNGAAYVTDGARIVLTNAASNGSQSLRVTSGECTGCGLTVSNGASVAVMSGEKTSYLADGGGTGNYLHVLDGGAVSFSPGFYFAYADADPGKDVTGNEILVSGEGSDFYASTFYLGRRSTAVNSNNVVRVESGGTFRAGVVYFQGNHSGFVVSNATVNLTGNVFRYPSSLENPLENPFFRFKGTTPRLNVPSGANGHWEIANGLSFVFDVPTEGYGTHLPVYFTKWGKIVDETMEIHVNGLKAVQKRMRNGNVRSETYTLIKMAGGRDGSVTDAMLARWNARLPTGASLRVDGGEIKLDVEARGETVLVLR